MRLAPHAISGAIAVSMRRVAARLGVSPIPLYSRVGNKDALLDAVNAQRRSLTVSSAAVAGERPPTSHRAVHHSVSQIPGGSMRSPD